MSLKHRVSQHFSRNGRSRFGAHAFGQERSSTCPPHRLVVLTLGLFNVVLLLAAAVIGIYCAKANDFQIPDSDITPLIVEINHLRNNTELIRAKEEAEAALAKERDAHLQLKKQVREKLTVTDELQKNLETLRKEREMLQANKTSLEESCGQCLPGWHLLRSHCYYITNHRPFLRKNWEDSRADCISKGSDLAVIDDPEEQSEIVQKLLNINFAKSVWWANGLWIGFTGPRIDGTWDWINSGKSVNSTQWKTGQPSVNESQSGNCGAFYHFGDRQKTLYNANCQTSLLNWICEMQQMRT